MPARGEQLIRSLLVSLGGLCGADGWKELQQKLAVMAQSVAKMEKLLYKERMRDEELRLNPELGSGAACALSASK